MSIHLERWFHQDMVPVLCKYVSRFSRQMSRINGMQHHLPRRYPPCSGNSSLDLGEVSLIQPFLKDTSMNFSHTILAVHACHVGGNLSTNTGSVPNLDGSHILANLDHSPNNFVTDTQWKRDFTPTTSD